MRHKLQKITKDHFLTLGYQVEEIDTEIFVIKNFLTNAEIYELTNFAESAPEKDWSEAYIDGVKAFARAKFGSDDLDALVKSGKLEITDNWQDKNLVIKDQDLINKINKRVAETILPISGLVYNGIDAIQRQYEGAELVVHVDNHTDPSLVYAAIMYLNDNYTNGELIFPERGISYRPKAGSLVIFPTHSEYLHGTNAPGPGPMRYVLPSFIGEEGFYQRNKY